MSNNQSHIIIREASATDAGALARLADLDSARAPQGRLLVAEVGGEIRAAVSATGGGAVADPFHPTAELVAMLRIEAGLPAEPAWGMRAPQRILRRSPRPAAPRPSSPSVPGLPVLSARRF